MGRFAVAVGLALSLAWSTARLAGQEGRAPANLATKAGEWPSYGRDLANTRYSPLDQINASNFSKLEVAWRFKTDFLGPRPEFKLEGTPLMVNGRLFATAGTRRAVVALDPETGEMLWMHSELEGPRGEASPRKLSGRGLAYWSDGTNERVLYVTIGFRLVALEAKTGARISSFGKDGLVDLKEPAVVGGGDPIDPVKGEIGLHATPLVAGNVVIVGGTFSEDSGTLPPTHNNIKGLVQAYDVRTGKRLWIFRTIPMPGEFGNETWEKDAWAVNGNNGVWTQMAIDEQLGLVYLPVETPTSDYYGGHRPGNNLFAESIVAVDMKTGQRKWHFQLVHHPIWGFDMRSRSSRSRASNPFSTCSIGRPENRSGRSKSGLSSSRTCLVKRPARRSPSRPNRQRTIGRDRRSTT